MQSIVNKVLSKYFVLFIKDFSPDQFELNFMKGTGALHNLELFEDVMQEMLMLPTTLLVTKVECDHLQLKIPMYFRTNPLELTLDNVVVHLEEPEVVPPPPNKLSALWTSEETEVKTLTPKEQRKAKERMDILRNLSYTVTNLTLLLHTRSTRNTVLRINFHNARSRSVNKDWKDVEKLSDSRTIDERAGTEVLYKLMTIESISISVSDPTQGIDTYLADNLPAQYRSWGAMRSLDGTALSSHHEFIFENMHFSWNQERYKLLMDFFASISACMSRDIPSNPDISEEMQEMAEVMDMQYRFKIANWSITMEDEEDEEGAGAAGADAAKAKKKAVGATSNRRPNRDVRGVRFAGANWALIWLPKRRKTVQRETKDLLYEDEEVFESVVQLLLPALECSDIVPDKHSSKRFPNFMSQVRKTKWHRMSAKRILQTAGRRKTTLESLVKRVENQDKEGEEPFFSVSMVSRWKVEDDGKKKIQASAGDTELRLIMNSMQIVVDRTAIGKVLKFLQGPPVDEEAEQREKILALFSKYDKDASGEIDLEEFQAMVSELSGAPLSRENAEQTLDEIDRDGNREIDFDEFYGWWKEQDAATATGEESTMGKLLSEKISWGAGLQAEGGGWVEWAQQTWLHLEIHDTHFVVPDSPAASGHFANTSIDFAIQKVHAFNSPKWHAVPNLPNGLSKLPRSKYVPILRETSRFTNRVKFQLEIEGLYCNVLSHYADQLRAPTVQRVIEPTKIVLYGRYVPAQKSGSISLADDSMELMCNMSRLNVTVTNLQYDYFFYTYNLHNRWWFEELAEKKPEEDAEKAAAAEAAAAAAAADAEKAEKEKQARKEGLTARDKADAAAKKVRDSAAEERRRRRQEALDKKSQRGGKGGVPKLSRLGKASGKGDDDGDKAKAVPDTPRSKALALRRAISGRPASGDVDYDGHRNIEDSSFSGFKTIVFFRIDEGLLSVPLNWVETEPTQTAPSKISFSALELVTEMGAHAATYLFAISDVEAKGLDHPSLPAFISLLPRKSDLEEAPHTLKLLYGTDTSSPQDPVTDIAVSFRNTSILFQAKKPGIADINEIVAGCQETGNQLSAYFSSHNEEVKTQVGKVSDASKVAVVAAVVAGGASEVKVEVPAEVRKSSDEKSGDGEEKSEEDGGGPDSAASSPGKDAKPAPVANMSYGLDVGECEILLFDAPDDGTAGEYNLPPPEAVPRSKVTIARVRQDNQMARMRDLETTAVQSKMRLVESEAERERLSSEVLRLTRELGNARAAAKSTLGKAVDIMRPEKTDAVVKAQSEISVAQLEAGNYTADGAGGGGSALAPAPVGRFSSMRQRFSRTNVNQGGGASTQSLATAAATTMVPQSPGAVDFAAGVGGDMFGSMAGAGGDQVPTSPFAVQQAFMQQQQMAMMQQQAMIQRQLAAFQMQQQQASMGYGGSRGSFREDDEEYDEYPMVTPPRRPASRSASRSRVGTPQSQLPSVDELASMMMNFQLEEVNEWMSRLPVQEAIRMKRLVRERIAQRQTPVRVNGGGNGGNGGGGSGGGVAAGDEKSVEELGEMMLNFRLEEVQEYLETVESDAERKALKKQVKQYVKEHQ